MNESKMLWPRCGIPANTLPPCDLEWGHEGNMHANGGDGFYARDYEKEHACRRGHREEMEKNNLDETFAVFTIFDLATRLGRAEAALRDIHAKLGEMMALARSGL